MSGGVVVRNIQRATPEVIAGLGEAGVATVHEAQGQKGLLDPAVRPIQSGARIAGSAITVESAPGDNIMVHAAIEVVEEGDVLMVALTSPAVNGMIGELVATSLRTHGCIGAVIDSGVRDTAELIEMGFPVWSRAIFSQGTTKASPGSVNVPIVCAGTEVEPGDVVVADDDGVVVVRREDAAEVWTRARQRIYKEIETRARLEAGDLAVDLYGLRERLADLGVEYVDELGELKP